MEEDERLQKVEDYIASGDLYSAQYLLNMIDEESGEKCYLQSLVYKEKCWYNEQRKMLKKAIKAEPSNQKYKKALDDLTRVVKNDTLREMEKSDKTDRCCNALCEGCCNGLWGC